jgi:hypothetical protein
MSVSDLVTDESVSPTSSKTTISQTDHSNSMPPPSEKSISPEVSWTTLLKYDIFRRERGPWQIAYLWCLYDIYFNRNFPVVIATSTF